MTRLSRWNSFPEGDADPWLTRALETDARVMADLGGLWPDEAKSVTSSR
jgi:hypothetical protein